VVTEGVLNVSAGTTEAGVAGTGTASVTLTGTIAQINDLLAGNSGGSITTYFDNRTRRAKARR
jgi:hypothetical protein